MKLREMYDSLKNNEVIHLNFPLLHFKIYGVESVTISKDGEITINPVYGTKIIKNVTDEMLDMDINLSGLLKL